MGNKGSFVFYTEYREHLSMLPPEQVGELMFALMDYQETGEVPDLPKGSALAMCFSFIKKRMDKDNSKYEERCERNRSNGKKGGRTYHLMTSRQGCTAHQVAVHSQSDQGHLRVEASLKQP